MVVQLKKMKLFIFVFCALFAFALCGQCSMMVESPRCNIGNECRTGRIQWSHPRLTCNWWITPNTTVPPFALIFTMDKFDNTYGMEIFDGTSERPIFARRGGGLIRDDVIITSKMARIHVFGPPEASTPIIHFNYHTRVPDKK